MSVITPVVMGKDVKGWTKPWIVSSVFPAERMILLSAIKLTPGECYVKDVFPKGFRWLKLLEAEQV